MNSNLQVRTFGERDLNAVIDMLQFFEAEELQTKGHLISKCPFGVSKSDL